ncbi:MAG: uL15 family ribosomal protein, partial [Anaeroplasmataceae bacterium]|nr:uL15 family ribosomal protein [Anaeroplasmataceae bacterium]
EEEPAEEPVAEEEPAEESVVEEEPEEELVVEEETAEDDQELRAVVQDGKMKYIVIKYSKSFLAKLIQSDDKTKNYYSELKNYLLSFKGVKSRISWKWETFRLGRKPVAKIRLRGKTLSLVMALDPLAYAESKYVVESVADVAAHADTPLLYRIKNDRRLRYAKELIDQLFQDNNVLVNPKASVVDYTKELPYESTVSLIERKLIKELTDEDASSGTMFKPRKSVSAVEVDNLMQDDVAELLVKQMNGVSDKTKAGIINIDTLSECFNDGEVVNLEAIKARVPGFDKKATYLKVLARGILNKELTVEADAFSIEAVKMIVLTGGKVIKK